MGIIVSKDNDQSKLQQRINSDLRNRAQTERIQDDPDLAEDIAYNKDLKKTGRFAWVWIVLVALACISIFCIIKI